MTGTRKSLRIMLSMLILLCLLASCGTGGTATNTSGGATAANSGSVSTGTASAGDGAASGEVTIGVAIDIGDLNPHMYTSQMYAQTMVYDGLVQYKDDEVQPALAESWEVSEDGKTITFKLRENAKFSDGTALTSANIVRNFDTLIANRERHSWLGVLTHIESYEVPDDYTFTVHLDDSYYPALQEFAHVRPLRILGDAGFPEGDDTSEGIAQPVGTGAWVLREHVDGEYAIFDRNEYYWGDAPKSETITMRVIPNSDTSVSSLEAGEVDAIMDFNQSSSMNVDQFQYLQDNGYGTLVSAPMMNRIIVMNTQNPILADAAVREAMIYSLDRDTIVQSVYGGLEPVADSLFSSNMPYCDIAYETTFDYDADRATAALDAAGWVDDDGDGVREKDGTKLSLTLYYNGEDTAYATVGQLMQSAYADIGIELNLQGEENQTTKDRWPSGEFDLSFYQSWGMPYDPHSTLGLMRSQLFAHAREGIEGATDTLALYEEIMVSTDEAFRAEGYETILNTWQSDMFYIPLSSVTNRAAWNDGISGVEFNIAFDLPLNNIAKAA